MHETERLSSSQPGCRDTPIQNIFKKIKLLSPTKLRKTLSPRARAWVPRVPIIWGARCLSRATPPKEERNCYWCVYSRERPWAPWTEQQWLHFDCRINRFGPVKLMVWGYSHCGQQVSNIQNDLKVIEIPSVYHNVVTTFVKALCASSEHPQKNSNMQLAMGLLYSARNLKIAVSLAFSERQLVYNVFLYQKQIAHNILGMLWNNV